MNENIKHTKTYEMQQNSAQSKIYSYKTLTLKDKNPIPIT